MRAYKTKITQFKNTFEQSNWFENNIENKQFILNEIEKLNAILSKIETYQDSFQKNYLKTEISKAIKESNKLLGLQRNPDNEEKIFKLVAGLVAQIKQTYLSVITEDKFHQDYEQLQVIRRLKEEEEELRNKINSFMRQFQELESFTSELDYYKSEYLILMNNIRDFHEKYHNTEEEVLNQAENVSNKSEQIDDFYIKIQEIFESLVEKKEIANANVVSVNEQRKEVDLLLNKSRNIADSLVEIKEKMRSSQNDLNDLTSDFNIQRESIQAIIEDANRASMAGAFKSRKDELKKPLIMSEILLYIFLVLIVIISACLLVYSTENNTIRWDLFLVRLPLILPFVWAAWVNGRKNAHLFRLREDYAYKYAAAMAFEGYKKQVQEKDSELMKLLLEVSIDNLGKNTSELLDKKVDSMPSQELQPMLDKILDKVK